MSATTKEGTTGKVPAAHRGEPDGYMRLYRTAFWRVCYWLARWIIIIAFRSFFMRLEIRGKEKVARKGPLVVCSNHVHNFDPVVVGAAIPRRLLYMAKKELFAVPGLRQLIRFFGAFPIDRGTADRAALRYAVNAVDEGFALLMFPEGTRSVTGKIEHVLPGAAFVALRTGAPVLPVAVTGTQALPFDKKSAKPGTKRQFRPRVTVTIGEPFQLSAGPDGKRPSMEAATDEMMRHVAALLPPEYRGIYADAATLPAGTEPA
jgi:1-acyl-sn-glycerol-3-phosphate acyltransferase